MKVFKISRYPIVIFMFSGIIMFLLSLLLAIEVFFSKQFLISHIFVIILGILFAFLLLGCTLHLLRKRKKGNGFYWDDEGIVIDTKGNKIYWGEIESIEYSNVRGIKSTSIYTYLSNQESIRIRLKKLMPSTVHSIEWFIIEKPKEYHKDLMKSWEQWRS